MSQPQSPQPRMLMPFVDLKAQFASIREEVMAAVQGVMESQRFIIGPQLQAFEQEMASYIGVPEAVALEQLERFAKEVMPAFKGRKVEVKTPELAK